MLLGGFTGMMPPSINNQCENLRVIQWLQVPRLFFFFPQMNHSGNEMMTHMLHTSTARCLSPFYESNRMLKRVPSFTFKKKKGGKNCHLDSVQSKCHRLLGARPISRHNSHKRTGTHKRTARVVQTWQEPIDPHENV